MDKISKIVYLMKKPNKLIRVLGSKGFLNFLPDKFYLKLLYWSETGNKLNLKKPKTFNEKLQWLKLYDRKEEYNQYVDKYEVRSYINKKIGGQYLIPILAVYNDVEDINWENLPNEFVLKCTHGSSSNIICRDKSKLDIESAKKKLNKWMKKNWYWFGREWVYKNVRPRIICEKYMVDESGTELKDYKLMCFNGRVQFIFVYMNRSNEGSLNVNIYDKNWKLLPIKRVGSTNSDEKIKRPKNLKKMIDLAEKISEDFPFLRIDFYEINNKIYFGEMTFYPGSGLRGFNPPEWDKKIGNLLTLPNKK